jgi:hypothetical protein
MHPISWNDPPVEKVIVSAPELPSVAICIPTFTLLAVFSKSGENAEDLVSVTLGVEVELSQFDPQIKVFPLVTFLGITQVPLPTHD